MSVPNLRHVLSVWKKIVEVTPEGDSVQVKSDEKRVFADITFKASPISTLEAPRQQSEIRAVIRIRSDLNWWRTKDYLISFEGKDWQVSSSFPHDNPAYHVLVLRDIV
jgi:hypothetical protein